MTRFALLFVALLFLGLAPAHAKPSQKLAKVPRNLEATQTHIDPSCEVKQPGTYCEEFSLRLFPKGGDAGTGRYARQRRVFRDKKTGERIFGVSHTVTDTEKKFETAWLIEPKWTNLHMLNSDVAYGQLAGTQDVYAIDTVAGTTTKIGQGDFAFGYALVGSTFVSYYESALDNPYLYETASDGTISIRMIDSATNSVAASVAIDRVVPQAQLPKGRSPIEVFADRTVLVHRLDANGKIFDQIFDASGAKALTPPMPPLVMAVYASRNHQMFVEIDRERRLLWPVRGSDVIAKPDDLIGLRPLTGVVTSQVKPLTPAELTNLYRPETPDSSPYVADLPVCVVEQPGCDITLKWTALWERDGRQIGLALLGDAAIQNQGYRQYDLPTYLEIAATSDVADYDFVRDLAPDPKQESIYSHGRAVYASRRFDGMFDVHAYDRTDTKGQFERINVASLPSENAAKDFWESQQQAARAQLAQSEAEQQAFRKQQTVELQQKVAAIAVMAAANQQAARAEQAKALAEGNYWLAMQIARRKLPQRDLYQTVMHAFDAGQEQAVGLADIEIAKQFANAEENARLNARANLITYQADLERAEAARAFSVQNMLTAARNYQGSPVSIPSSASNSGASSSTANTALENAQFESRMNYLEGKTGQYLCGSSSFCD